MNNLGCSFLEEGINFEADTVCDCCICHHFDRGRPLLIENYHGENIDWDFIFNLKAERIKAQKEKTIYPCKDCYRLSDYSFKNERIISEFHFSHCQICNAKCIYCSDDRNGGKKNYDVLPVITDLIQKGYYKEGGEATFQGGEPTLMLHFDELIDLFIKNGTAVRVHTNAIKYSPKIVEALKTNNGLVVSSLDSGCRKTYKKIKQVDAFDISVENIKKYSSANPDKIIIKYLILPGFNDNLKEIDKFFKLMKKIGIKQVALDIESKYATKYQNRDISPHIYLLVDYFNKKANEKNIKVIIYSYMFYVLENREIEPAKYMAVKPIFSFIINKLNEKHKNLDYYSLL